MMGYRTTRRQIKHAIIGRRGLRDPISIAQKVFRDWCKTSKVAVDALSAAQLVSHITAAIIEDREAE